MCKKTARREPLAIFELSRKELDEETGFYYHGARYLNPKTSIWISADPAMGDYIPQAPVDDEAKKHNENLPGMGGVYNYVNFHVYHYAGNNPVKYVDPDGEAIWFAAVAAIGAAIGAAVSVGIVAYGDLISGNTSSIGTYVGAAVGGAVTGVILSTTANSVLAGAAGAAAGNTAKQLIDKDVADFSGTELGFNIAIGAAAGKIPGARIPGITSGKGSMLAVARQMETKLANGTISNMTIGTAAKVATGRSVQGALLEGTIAAGGINFIVDEAKKPNSRSYNTNGTDGQSKLIIQPFE